MNSTSERSTASRDLFLADLDRLEESIWRNEEIGDKRFNFFVTFAGAVGGGLAALWSSERSSSDTFRAALTMSTSVALVALLVFGLVSFRRMMHRDKVTAEYKRDTKMIRRKYRVVFEMECSSLKDYELEMESNSQKAETDFEHRWRRFKQMGYTQTLAVINGILLSALVMSTTRNICLASMSGPVLIIVLCYIGGKPYERAK